jgi:hypothetical protein
VTPVRVAHAPKSGAMDGDGSSAPKDIAIRRLMSVDQAEIDGLADLLIDAIESGAGVSFMHPLEPAKSRAFWRTPR